MIKSNELRIGNLFKDKHSNTIIEVIGLNKTQITFSGSFNNKWQAEPIPLTEEILLKCGFEKRNHIYDGVFYLLKIKDPNIKIKIDKTYTIIEGIKTINHCKNLHQLQNLYFVLTGKELNVNI